MPLIPVRIDDPRLDLYRDLPRSNLTRLSGRFIAEGDKLVERLLRSSYPTESLLVEPRHAERMQQLAGEEMPIFMLPGELLQELVGFRLHRGVLACGRRRPNPPLEQVVPGKDQRALIAVCAGVQDPENVGGIFRNSAALGADAVLIGPGCADPFSRRVLRVSMGAVFRIPCYESSDLEQDLRRLRDELHVELVATVLDPTAEPLASTPRSTRTALLFGGEGHGLDPRCIEQCDRRVTIDMHHGTDSLNVSVAAAIFLYHFSPSRDK